MNDNIEEKFKEILESMELPIELVLVTKSFKKHASVFCIKNLLFRIGFDKELIFQVTSDYHDLFSSGEVKDRWLEIDISSIDELAGYSTQIQQIFESELNKVHGDAFHCCSRYLECSENKACVHSDFIFSLSCHYRLQLKRNRVFFGANRNI